jgi:hypothetical protein
MTATLGGHVDLEQIPIQLPLYPSAGINNGKNTCLSSRSLSGQLKPPTSIVIRLVHLPDDNS